MSNQTPPVVPEVFIINSQSGYWQLATLGRLATVYATPTTVRCKVIEGTISKHGTPVGKLASLQQGEVYCLPTSDAWQRVMAARAAFQAALDALAGGLRELGSYASRLKEAGGLKHAPNPLTPTVISADDPDTKTTSWWLQPMIVPMVERWAAQRHTAKMVEIDGRYAPGSFRLVNQADHFVCPDDAAWSHIEALHGAVKAAHEGWGKLLREVGTYSEALGDGRYKNYPILEETMPRRPTYTPPVIPPVPDDLPGWAWESRNLRGEGAFPECRLYNTTQEWGTNWYLMDHKAIAEARRRVLSQPKVTPITMESPMTTTTLATLTDSERQALSAHEQTIEAGQQTFFAVGKALMVIRSQRLYRETHASFDTYCRERWQINKQRASQLEESARIVGLIEASKILDALPANDSQARALNGVPDADVPAVWQEAVATAPAGKVTAAHVEVVAAQHKPPPVDPTPEQRILALLSLALTTDGERTAFNAISEAQAIAAQLEGERQAAMRAAIADAVAALNTPPATKQPVLSAGDQVAADACRNNIRQMKDFPHQMASYRKHAKEHAFLVTDPALRAVLEAEIAAAEQQPGEPWFWASKSANHPTAHHWHASAAGGWVSACGISLAEQPTTGATAGQCSICEKNADRRETVPIPEAAPPAPPTPGTVADREAIRTQIFKRGWLMELVGAGRYRAWHPNGERVAFSLNEAAQFGAICEQAAALEVLVSVPSDEPLVLLYRAGEDTDQLMPLPFEDALNWLASETPPAAAAALAPSIARKEAAAQMETERRAAIAPLPTPDDRLEREARGHAARGEWNEARKAAYSMEDRARRNVLLATITQLSPAAPAPAPALTPAPSIERDLVALESRIARDIADPSDDGAILERLADELEAQTEVLSDDDYEGLVQRINAADRALKSIQPAGAYAPTQLGQILKLCDRIAWAAGQGQREIALTACAQLQQLLASDQVGTEQAAQALEVAHA